MPDAPHPLGQWLPIGGHIELDEDPEQAAYREAREESGLEIELIGERQPTTGPGTRALVRPRFLDIHRVSPTHEHIGIIYLARPRGGTVTLAPAEHHDIRWCDAADLEKLVPPMSDAVKYYCLAAIREVAETIGVSSVLVILLIFLFLRNLRSTLIPSAAIPISILGTFALLYLLGYSVNILTLLALVLAIGIVVDDAIVVLENIVRHIEAGMTPLEASRKAMQEITGAILAITASLVVVFLPIAFQKGTTGILFREFAITLAGAVTISAFVALSLSPALGAHFLRPVSDQLPGGLRWFELCLEKFYLFYARSLDAALRHRRIWLGLGAGILALTILLYRLVPQEFLPEEDKGVIVAVIITPEGSTSESTDQYVRQAEKIAADYPETRVFFSAVALSRGAPGQANQGIMFIRLKADRNRTAQQLARPGARGSMFTRMITEIRGAVVIPFLPKAVGRGFGETFQVVLQGADLVLLEKTARNLRDEIDKAGFL
ncbi:MAG: NUDIX domain-containing protein, partial [Verrucomicrobia bacterium]|nr:NUDIX domain-containing protein [Verrucomicrobiota bacterium]